MIVKNLLIGVLAGLAVWLQADVVELPRLPTADRLDTEVVLDWPFNRTRQDVCDFNFDLAFVGTPSNNVEVALGRDDDGDGKLSFAETGVFVGWRRGDYYIERRATGEVFRQPASHTNGYQGVLTWKLHFGAPGTAPLWRLSDDWGALFADTWEEVPGWIYDPAWNLMRLTARGMDEPEDIFVVQVDYRSFHIFLR